MLFLQVILHKTSVTRHFLSRCGKVHYIFLVLYEVKAIDSSHSSIKNFVELSFETTFYEYGSYRCNGLEYIL